MLFIDCYGKDVYIGEELVGYVNKHGVIYINQRKFGNLTDDGRILLEEKYEAGHIEENGDIYLNSKNVGHLTANNDLYFSPKKL